MARTKNASNKKSNWLSYEEAKALVRSENVGSRQQYLDWHDANKPKRLSKYPHRVYTNDWTSWNDFLGTDNKFNQGKKSFRPYNESIMWVHKLGIEGGRDGWLTWLEQHGDDLPSDIPRRPDLHYKKDWSTWRHWLGDRVVEKVEAQQKALQESGVYYIIRETNYAHLNNVYSFGLERGGVSALKSRWTLDKFQVVKLFKFDPSQTESIKQIINQFSTPYESEHVRTVTNIHEICWELVNVLEPIS